MINMSKDELTIGANPKSLEFKIRQVKSYAKNTLTKKFYIDTEFDDDAANAIAIASILGSRRADVWVNGELINLQNLSLKISLQLKPQQQESD